MPRRASSTATQLSIPDDTGVEMEMIAGCRGTTAVVLITATTNGALVSLPATIARHEVAVEEGTGLVRVTLWVRSVPSVPAA